VERDHPDQKYVDAMLNNNATLLEEIYQRFFGKVRGMILRSNGAETDAADIFQEALFSIYKKAKNQRFILTCPFESFLYLVCKNKWLNELSKRKVQSVTIIEADGFNNVAIGEDSIEYTEDNRVMEGRRHLLLQKMNELGESCKELLRLSWSGKSMEEVAEILKVTYGYARKKKCSCMARLIASVKDSPEFNSLRGKKYE
jgi:RNA polymerase sigma factor (sigma-70 family)